MRGNKGDKRDADEGFGEQIVCQLLELGFFFQQRKVRVLSHWVMAVEEYLVTQIVKEICIFSNALLMKSGCLPPSDQ